jgi:KDO2-lipid IV(A) lauroyltransferase
MLRPENVSMDAARDVREGERWTLSQRIKNDGLFLAVTIALAIVRSLPVAILRGLGIALGAIAWAALPSARKIAHANVARVFPNRDPRALRAFVRKNYLTLGRELGEAIAMLGPARRIEYLRFAPGALDIMDRAVREGRGVLFASAHLGPWERVAASIVAAGIPMTVVAREAYDPRLTQIYRDLRCARGVRVVWRGASGAGAGLLRTLKRGEVLGVPMDLASRVPSIDVPFLGMPAATAIGPARLALRTHAAVVVGTVDATRTITMTRISTENVNERALTARINAELSARVLAFPEAWPWMHPRWRTKSDSRSKLDSPRRVGTV